MKIEQEILRLTSISLRQSAQIRALLHATASLLAQRMGIPAEEAGSILTQKCREEQQEILEKLEAHDPELAALLNLRSFDQMP